MLLERYIGSSDRNLTDHCCHKGCKFGIYLVLRSGSLEICGSEIRCLSFSKVRGCLLDDVISW